MGLKRGLVQVYTGEGKGKTTAALGLAMRAAGHGLRVFIIQFMKGWPNYGELKTVGGHPQITLRQFGRPEFVDPEKPEPVDREMAQEALREARRALTSASYDLLILDDVEAELERRGPGRADQLLADLAHVIDHDRVSHELELLPHLALDLVAELLLLLDGERAAGAERQNHHD